MSSGDAWAAEKMGRSDAQRRYMNLVTYQLRPMTSDRKKSDEERIQILKRIISQAHRFRYEAGVVAQGGTREEVVELLRPLFQPERGHGEELLDWMKRTMRAFGASPESTE